VLGHPGGRSAEVSWTEVAESQAEVLIVAPCGFDEAAARAQLDDLLTRPEVAGLPAIAAGRVHAIDADAYVVRPGPRLVDGVEQLTRLIHSS